MADPLQDVDMLSRYAADRSAKDVLQGAVHVPEVEGLETNKEGHIILHMKNEECE